MSLSFLKLCRDMNLETAPEGHKHHMDGWVNVECPFCKGNDGFHLGYEEETDRFNCWRCGSKRHTEALQGLLNCTAWKARQLLTEYKEQPRDRLHRDRQVPSKVRKSSLSLPYGTSTLKAAHKRYLKSRHFDPDKLVSEWDLKGTGGIGEYKFRVIAPIYYEGKLVSYQGRDITNRSPLPYKACRKEDEVRDHKTCLYGYDEASLLQGCVVVEGIADAWRLGKGSVATFGIGFTRAQILLLKSFQNRYILFDADAVDRAKQLAQQLSIFNGHTEVIILKKGDPADMKQTEADSLMKDLMPTR